ncbi:Tc toxin subunit A-related protein [Nocardia pseudovaccinii]|uniref:Tc toxin subunit A-related protein n=1 Tax=Nocardia pseudovaccinii TaxID=189540 RepID=UPI0007A5663E|nr:neuraminidase-like domain-containing protein [Nocardia pseudovaccinii]
MTSEVIFGNRVVVAGIVRDSNGGPAGGVEVSVFERRLRSEVPLGECITGADGQYRVDFSASSEAVGLTVRASVDGRSAAAVVRTGERRVDLQLPVDERSEYARLLAAVTPLLDGVSIGGLDDADSRSLAQATRFEDGQVEALVGATRAAEETGLPAELFYGVARRGLPGDPLALGRWRPIDIAEALDAAAADAMIESADGAADFADAVRAWHIAAAVDPDAKPTPEGELFVVAVPDRDARERLYAAHLDDPGAVGERVTGLVPDDATAPYLERLRLAMQLRDLTENNLPLVRELLGEFDSGRLRHPRELVTLETQWAGLIERGGAIPAASAASSTAGDSAAYAQRLHERLIDAFPAYHLAHEMSARAEHVDTPAARFFADNPDFDILGTPVTATTVADEPTKRELGEIQRTFKITRRFDAMQALRDNGLTSARSVAELGPDMFARMVSGTVDEDEAHRIHARAAEVHATAANLLADFRQAGHFDVSWLPTRAAGPSTQPIPDWEELFGSADYGTFAPSRSVYGQPAYLVDLLYFLRRLGGGNDQDEGPVANALYARRPDLADIELGDDNTDLSLPYVDLINELLESAVAPSSAVPTEQRQSSGDAATLRVQPQHVNPGAYDLLRSAVFPWDLPFDLYREQTDAYLARAGATRTALLETLGAAADSPNLLTDERLGLATVAAQIIAGEQLTPPRSLAEFWGRPATADLLHELDTVRKILDAGSMRYAELTRLLETRFVNPTGALKISPTPAEPYNTDKMVLTGLDIGALDRIHRFVRLQRALGWPAAQLDRAIFGANNGGRLDRTTLRGIDAIRRMAARLDLPVDEVLTFYNVIETRVYPSDSEPPLFDRLFLDPAVVTTEPGVPNPFALRPGRAELNVVGNITVAPVTAALLGVLQITDADLAALTTGPRSVTPDQVLSLANLSALVRTVTLARALSLSIPDLLRLIELYGDGGPFPLLAAAFAGAGPESEPSGGAPMLPGLVRELPVFTRGVEAEPAGGAPVDAPTSVEIAPPPPTDAQSVVTERFLDAVWVIRNAGFGVAELDAVLADTMSVTEAVIPADATLIATLTTLRTALQAVYQQTGQTSDEHGELTRKQLTLLGWDPALAQDALATLLGAVTYRADLAVLPVSVTLPSNMPVRYSSEENALLFLGPMTTAQYNALKAQASTDTEYQTAVRALYDQPRAFVTGRMKALRIPVYATALAQLPANYETPKALVGKVYYDISDHTLKSRGYLSETDAEALRAVAPRDTTYVAAVDDLMKNQEAPASPDNVLLTAQDAGDFFDTGEFGPALRFERVLGKLNPVLRRTLSEITVKQQLGQAAGLDPASVDLLLGTWLRSSSGSIALQDFLTPQFVGSDPAVPIGRAGFDRQLTSLALVHRVALVMTKLAVTAPEIPFLFTHAAGSAWLDFNALPAAPVSGASPLFADFVRLLELIRVRGNIPGGFSTLAAVFAAARRAGAHAAEVIAALAVATGWNRTDTAGLSELLGLVAPERFTGTGNLSALVAASRLLSGLGVTVDRLPSWLRANVGPDAAQAAWKTAKAKYSLADWPVVAAPMQDALRERQRGALVSYLVANPLLAGDNTVEWHDVNGLHDYFLLDVEMGATQLTSRTAQAIYSVQLFVQRCLLNLEPRVRTADTSLWQQWEWMKQYRLWEANQKVFLYPENYFEPDLRPDKTSFFADLENEIMQKEITAENVTAAAHRYLEKLSEVARLHPCGTYWDKDTGVTYVFARNDSTPRVYYYRTWEQRAYWTAWKKIDLDIGSENLVPIIWNKQLYLFWPTFAPANDPQEIDHLPDSEHHMQSAPRYWNIKMEWSRLNQDGWQAKRISEGAVNTKPFLPSPRFTLSVDFKQDSTNYYRFDPEFDGNGDLVIHVSYNHYVGVYDSSPDPGRPSDYGCMPRGSFRLSARSGRMEVAQLAPADLNLIIEGPVAMNTFNNEFEGGQMQWGDDRDPDFPLLTTVVQRVPSPPLRVLFSYRPQTDWANFFMFLSDGIRSFLVEVTNAQPRTFPWMRARPFYHPYVEQLLAALTIKGFDALTARDIQLQSGRSGGTYLFEQIYDVNPRVIGEPYPDEDIDFTDGGPYAQYNWELLFHLPLMIAERLGTNQKFEEAQKWFHCVFDPTDRSGLPAPQRFWRTKPFFLTAGDPSDPNSDYYHQRIEEILKRLAEGNTDEQKKVRAWLANPFQPDVVARLRSVAYQKAIVMKYLDNLIAWGDQLFRQDTGESVNQAAQLYILAAELLGRRPEEVFDTTTVAAQSFRRLKTSGPAPAPVVAAEHLVPVDRNVAVSPGITVGVGPRWYDYFRVPRNDKLLAYWDVVEDRLFKIRTGRNLAGVARPLASFGSVIDPNLLVRAVASGLDLATVLDDISAPVPRYRFAVSLAKAKELAAQVKDFGAALLVALEKRDAEAMARLQSSHRRALLDAVKNVKEQQVSEASDALEAAKKGRDLAVGKHEYYSSRDFMNGWEITHTALTGGALVLQAVAQGILLAAGATAHIPEAKLGFVTTVGATYGGRNVSKSLENLAGALGIISGIASGGGALAATIGGYRRRADDWDFQASQAQIEMDQADKQILAASVRVQIATYERDNHTTEITQAKEIDQFLHTKFTGQELYDWMVGQLATLYFQAYQLAYDVAKRAERAYRHELGVAESGFVNFGYWDSLHKGLLSGERLLADLNRMDAAYLEANAREFELTKRISLAQLDAGAPLRLKETGTCYVSLPEALFDLDTPGHYFRRIKSLAITVPCVAGPYAGVNLTATLLDSSVRIDPRLTDNKYPRAKGTDTRFRDYTGPLESIVTSTGQQDSGLFETNLHDERFLPFEGMGAISRWQLSLPNEFRQFDYETITDVVLQLRYTARDGGSALGNAAVDAMKQALDDWVRGGGGKGLVRLFSARREFADQWYRFLGTPAGGTASATFVLSKSRFPQLFRDRRYTVSNPELVLVLSQELIPDGTKRYVDCYPRPNNQLLHTTLTVGSAAQNEGLKADPTLSGLPRAGFATVKSIEITDTGQNWVVTAPISELDPRLLTADGRLNPDAVLDLLLVCPFTLKDRN